MYQQLLASFGPLPATSERSVAFLDAEWDAGRRFSDSVFKNPHALLVSPGEGTLAEYAELMRRHLDCTAVVITIAQPFASLIEETARGEECRAQSHVCALAPGAGEPNWVEKALADPTRLADPLTAGDLGYGFYAGVPLRLSSGCNVGTLAAVDISPRDFGKDELARLKMLANIIVQNIELRLATA